MPMNLVVDIFSALFGLVVAALVGANILLVVATRVHRRDLAVRIIEPFRPVLEMLLLEPPCHLPDQPAAKER